MGCSRQPLGALHSLCFAPVVSELEPPVSWSLVLLDLLAHVLVFSGQWVEALGG